MKIKRIEHVGVVVQDVEKSRALWEGCFGIKLDSVETNPTKPVKLAIYPIGESMVELIAGTTPDSRHQKMVARGQGRHQPSLLRSREHRRGAGRIESKGYPDARRSAAHRPRRLPHRLHRSESHRELPDRTGRTAEGRRALTPSE